MADGRTSRGTACSCARAQRDHCRYCGPRSPGATTGSSVRLLWPAKQQGPLLADRSTVCLYVFLPEGLKRQHFFPVVAREALGPLLAARCTVVVCRRFEGLRGKVFSSHKRATPGGLSIVLIPADRGGNCGPRSPGATTGRSQRFVAREALGPLLADRSTVCLYVFLTEGLKRQNFFQS